MLNRVLPKKGFEAVREAFVANFEYGKELGAACCVYYRGEKVVDLWSGMREKSIGEPWEDDTMALVKYQIEHDLDPADVQASVRQMEYGRSHRPAKTLFVLAAVRR